MTMIPIWLDRENNNLIIERAWSKRDTRANRIYVIDLSKQEYILAPIEKRNIVISLPKRFVIIHFYTSNRKNLYVRVLTREKKLDLYNPLPDKLILELQKLGIEEEVIRQILHEEGIYYKVLT